MRRSLLATTLLGGAVACLVLLASPPQASGQARTDAPVLAQGAPQRGSRELGGHAFIPSRVVGDPFITTHVRTATGFGIAFALKTPFIDVDGDTLGTLEGDVAFLQLGFEYRHAFNNWLALAAGVTTAARLGTNEQAMLAQGVSAVYGIKLEGLARIWGNERMILSAVARVSGSNLYGLTPFQFAQSIIDNGGLTEDNKLLVEFDGLSAAGGLRFAYAPVDWAGLTALVEAGSAEALGESDRDFLYVVGGAVDFDLRSRTSVPLGLLLAVQHDEFSEQGSDIARGLRAMVGPSPTWAGATSASHWRRQTRS
ncbi:MAG: hypothetical protein JSV86_13910 [Gemmatimonadota bacterium]|nr:MAG: hypothetical protein JSV86_13910 [Gemmatimonadota bacterium]